MFPDDPVPCATVIQRTGVSLGRGGGRTKVDPEDFVVEELPAYEPCGQGDHLYLLVRKRDVSGSLLVREIARRCGVRAGDVGMAGMKDRRAVTTQWISVPVAPGGEPAVGGEVGAGGFIEIVRATRHTNKLRTGHLKGNRFRIRVHGRDSAEDEGVGEVLEWYAAHGFPNAFGPQRFTRGAVRDGLQSLGASRRVSGRRQRFAVSAVQAWIFNHWLSRRAAAGLLTTALPGDVLKRRETGGLFVCAEPAEDTPRLERGEVVLTGPMPGSRPSMIDGEAAEYEAVVIAELGLDPSIFSRMGRAGRGTRRPALAWPREVGVSREGETLEICFELDSGTYATVLLALLCGNSLQVGDERKAGDKPSIDA